VLLSAFVSHFFCFSRWACRREWIYRVGLGEASRVHFNCSSFSISRTEIATSLRPSDGWSTDALLIGAAACIKASPIPDLRGSPSVQTKLGKMMDPTKIAPFNNVDLVSCEIFLTFFSFNSKQGCISVLGYTRWSSSRPTRET
jgi:hypothetical protein